MKLQTIRLTVIRTVAAVIRRLTSTQYAEQQVEIIGFDVEAPEAQPRPRAVEATAGLVKPKSLFNKSPPASALPRVKDNPKLLDVQAGLDLIGCENPDELWNKCRGASGLCRGGRCIRSLRSGTRGGLQRRRRHQTRILPDAAILGERRRSARGPLLSLPSARSPLSRLDPCRAYL
jgi:hypothetical protein